jgi:hypothetical protein
MQINVPAMVLLRPTAGHRFAVQHTFPLLDTTEGKNRNHLVFRERGRVTDLKFLVMKAVAWYVDTENKQKYL